MKKRERFQKFLGFLSSYCMVPLITLLVMIAISVGVLLHFKDDIFIPSRIWVFYVTQATTVITAIWMAVYFVCDKIDDYLYYRKKDYKR